MTLKELERRIEALRNRQGDAPPFEEFQEEWRHMDGLSKSLYITQAACPELFGGLDDYGKTISGYLECMGLVDQHQTLADIIEGEDIPEDLPEVVAAHDSAGSESAVLPEAGDCDENAPASETGTGPEIWNPYHAGAYY